MIQMTGIGSCGKNSDWADEFIQLNGNVWISKANCQQYARFMARKRGLTYSQDVAVVVILPIRSFLEYQLHRIHRLIYASRLDS